MIRLVRLELHAFRNLQQVDVRTDAPVVALVGPNAQGKTNTLEAIWLLATWKPLRARRGRELVRFGEETARVQGHVEHQGVLREHRVEIGPAGRSAFLDDKPAHAQSYFSDLRAIAFVPGDGAIVLGEPIRRRAWVDRAAFTASPAHLDVVRVYKRTLEQKAALLRKGPLNHQVLDALDESLAVAAVDLVKRRRRLIEELAPHAERMHIDLSGGSRLQIRYRSHIGGDDPLKAARELLAGARVREIERRMPLAGPHTDDVDLLVDGNAARAYGSQGQVRTVVLALKLAELLAARERGVVPLFLLDDVGSELDRDRQRRLLSVLGETGAQVFATSTHRDHLRDLGADARWFDVSGGVVTPA